MISVIFPTHNEEDTVEELHRRITAAMRVVGEPYEIIAVDDSTDGTTRRLRALRPLTLLILSYRMGQTAAIDAGIHAARGDILVILDADLQNDPADIPLLIAKIREGYDAAVGWRKERHDALHRRFFSRCANALTRWIAGVPLHDFGCALRAFRREKLAGVHLYGVMHVFIPVILTYRGGKIAEVPVRHGERRFGVTKYTVLHMASDIADLLTIKFLYGYAARPFVFFGAWALSSAAMAFLAVLAAVLLKWFSPFGLALGFSQTPLPILASLCIILSFLLLMLGFVVELLIRIYYEGRHTTPYQIKGRVELK